MSQTHQLSVEDALRQAVSLHQAGRLQEAEDWYRAILQAMPGHLDANHNLGLLLQVTGPAGANLPYLHAAYTAVPDNAHFVLSYASALQIDDPAHAELILQDAIDRGVISAEIWCNLANLLRADGKSEEAKQALRAALQIRPTYAIAYFNLASIEHDEGQLELAAKNYRHAIENQANFAQAHNNLGLIFRDQGDESAAIAQFAAALIIDPQYAQAAFNRAQGCLKLERRDQALANFLWAACAVPDFAQAHNEAGLILLSLGDVTRAASCFQAAIAVQPDFVPARVNLVNALMAARQWHDALMAVQRAIAVSPDCAAAYHNLGAIQQHFNDFEGAEFAYRKALAIGSDFADSLLGLAAVLRYHDVDATIALCQRALDLRPDYASARVLLAECWAARGRFADAEDELQRAIVVEPTMPEAWSAIPTLRKMTQADARWLARAVVIADSGLSPEKESFLRFALGKALDDLGEYASAFQQFQTANALAKLGGIPYNADVEEGCLNLICQDYSSDWLSRRRTQVCDSSRPVFVLGMPRSGTSLVEQILSAHPSIAGAGELSFWSDAAAQFSPFPLDASPRRMPTEQELFALSTRYLDQLSRFDANAERVIDKMPANFRCLGLSHSALPNARIVHVQRHPIDTCLSIYFQHFESYHSYANDLDNLAHFYRLYRRLMSHWTSILPKESILHLSYEALVQDTEGETRKLLDFLGLPWDASCLIYQNVQRRVGTASNWQVRQPINHRSVERWRNYERELGPLVALLGEDK
jgi:tetratricopeptide (TPR) repeat protein